MIYDLWDCHYLFAGLLHHQPCIISICMWLNCFCSGYFSTSDNKAQCIFMFSSTTGWSHCNSLQALASTWLTPLLSSWCLIFLRIQWNIFLIHVKQFFNRFYHIWHCKFHTIDIDSPYKDIISCALPPSRFLCHNDGSLHKIFTMV